MSRIVIALGGNALGDTPAEQQEKVAQACRTLVELIAQGHEIVVSHGNGPQVGMINLAFDVASSENPKVAAMPLQECTAMSQGYIGCHLQKALNKELASRGFDYQAVTVVTQVEVDPADPAFHNPTKPIGAFYDEKTAAQMRSADPELHMKEDSGRGWRRLVPSPKPVDIVEKESISKLLDHEFVVVACGGGGVPVVKKGEGVYETVSAVIDKDYASAKLAQEVGADRLVILTAVDRVCVNFGKPDQKEIAEMTIAEAEKFIAEGQFAPGSMLPKVEAAMAFVRTGNGRRAVIASLEKAPLAMRGESGTWIKE